MFKNWTWAHVAYYTLFLIFFECCWFGLEDAVIPSLWVMIIGCIVVAIIQLAIEEKRKKETQDYITNLNNEIKTMLDDELEKRKRAEADEIRRFAQESREAREQEARLKAEAEEVLERLRRENNNRTE